MPKPVSIRSSDSSVFPSGQLSADILVIGGGIMGLWGAVKAAQAGLTVTLIERGQIGRGGSGGLLGALFPWMPDRWDAKKQFQFDALTSLPVELTALEAETGLSASYRRSGRIIPLPGEHLTAIARRHEKDALANWSQPAGRFFWHVGETPAVADYLAPGFGDGGYVHDTLAARCAPRAITAVLKAWLMRQPGVNILEQTELTGLEAREGHAEVGNAKGAIRFSRTFIAAGVESFPMLQNLLPPLPKPLGQGVKGQAALFRAAVDPDWPVVFLDGAYVVPHENGHVAVGSTSENHYSDPLATDHHLDAVLDKARALVPALRDAEILERWAGVRPKAIERDPLVGPVPGHENIISLTGGFKISFGMAHRLAACAVDYALGRPVDDLPENFTLAGQLARQKM